MKYNAKYDVWCNKDGLVWAMSRTKDRLVIRQSYYHQKYFDVHVKNHKTVRLHRLIWETFNGEIPKGYEIDHIDGDTSNNSLSNLRCVTHLENIRNPITLERSNKVHGKYDVREKISRAQSKNSKHGFGMKFTEHFKIFASENKSLHCREYRYFKKHGHCSWEVLDEHN